MHVQSILFFLAFLSKFVSPQTSETVFTKTVTITDDGQPFEETAILSIEFGGPTQTVSGEIIDKGETQLITAVIASQTLAVNTSLTVNGTTEENYVQCRLDDHEGACIQLDIISNSVTTLTSTTSFLETLPSGDFFDPLPTNATSSSPASSSTSPNSVQSPPGNTGNLLGPSVMLTLVLVTVHIVCHI